MNNRSEADSLELEVSNFGPIVEAKLNLRPFTVFVGRSNTGKSYLAVLIYALHRYFSARHQTGRHRLPLHFRMLQSNGNREISKHDMSAIVALAKRVLQSKDKILAKDGIVLPGLITDALRSDLGENEEYLGNEVGRCFGLDHPGALIRKVSNTSARIDVRTYAASGSTPLEHRLTISPGASEYQIVVPADSELRLANLDGDYPLEYLRRLATDLVSKDSGNHEIRQSSWSLLDILVEHVLPQTIGPLGVPAFYLPADRTGVMHSHNVVVSALLESAAMTGLRPAARTPMLSGVLADFLDQLINFDRLPYRRRKPGHDVGIQIEETILGGAVKVDKSEAIGYPHFTYRPKGWKDSLPLMNASSMVSELAPVVLYLRHMVGPGNVLIVEEPESHLHPAMQVEFTRQLAALVKSGIKVIITTHSDWVLEELANIVRRFPVSSTNTESDFNGKIALHPDQVGAWLFKEKKRPKGSVVEEIKLDDESGLYPIDFDAVGEELYNDSASIFRKMQTWTVQ